MLFYKTFRLYNSLVYPQKTLEQNEKYQIRQKEHHWLLCRQPEMRQKNA